MASDPNLMWSFSITSLWRKINWLSLEIANMSTEFIGMNIQFSKHNEDPLKVDFECHSMQQLFAWNKHAQTSLIRNQQNQALK